MLFNPKTIFTCPFQVSPRNFGYDDVWFYQCLTTLYGVCIYFSVIEVFDYLYDDTKSGSLLWTFLEWYSSHSWWKGTCGKILDFHELRTKTHQELSFVKGFFFIRRPYFQSKTCLIWSQDCAYEWMFLADKTTKKNIRPLVQHLCDINDYRHPIGKRLCTIDNFPPFPENSLVLDLHPPIQPSSPSLQQIDMDWEPPQANPSSSEALFPEIIELYELLEDTLFRRFYFKIPKIHMRGACC